MNHKGFLVIAMSLKFPNARLFMHNLLAKRKISGAEAIHASAREFGLLDAEHEPCNLADGPCGCSCMNAARTVLIGYLDGHRDRPDVDYEQVWRDLMEEAKQYEHSARTSCSSSSEPPDRKQHDCAKFAPALFDLMLQQIGRYA